MYKTATGVILGMKDISRHTSMLHKKIETERERERQTDEETEIHAERARETDRRRDRDTCRQGRDKKESSFT